MRAVWSLDFFPPSVFPTRPVENDFFRESAENMFAEFCKGQLFRRPHAHRLFLRFDLTGRRAVRYKCLTFLFHIGRRWFRSFAQSVSLK